MTPSSKCEALIKEFEGCRLTAYQDGGGVWTIGWGHTGRYIHEGMTITQSEADGLLDADIQDTAYAVENTLVYTPVNQNQFDALVSFAFNEGAWRTSTLFELVKAGEYSLAADQFSRWKYVDGKVEAGLVRRRAAEAALFLEV